MTTAPGHGETEATCKTCGDTKVVERHVRSKTGYGNDVTESPCPDCQPAQATGRGEGGAVHELKTWPVYFNALLDGSKTFEVRKADRDFRIGDTLRLQEWDPARGMLGSYTGRETSRNVTYILGEGSPFAFPGYVVMGLSRVSQPAASGPASEVGLAGAAIPDDETNGQAASGGGEGAEVERWLKDVDDAACALLIRLNEETHTDEVIPQANALRAAIGAALSRGKGKA